MMQKKTIACDNYSIAERLRGFTVSAELGPGQARWTPSGPNMSIPLTPVSHGAVLYSFWRCVYFSLCQPEHGQVQRLFAGDAPIICPLTHFIVPSSCLVKYWESLNRVSG